MECNQTIISGKLIRLGVLRYTPAGVAVIEFTVNHVSRQREAGAMRQIIFDIFAIAMDQLALGVAEFQIDSMVRLTGFLNRKSHMNHQLVLHANHIELI
ncbi:MAG: primosomal replication protein N [Nitrosomonas sp.]|nr:primosomal replication protein N [Nitrosomonas sp.]